MRMNSTALRLKAKRVRNSMGVRGRYLEEYVVLGVEDFINEIKRAQDMQAVHTAFGKLKTSIFTGETAHV